MPAEPGRAFSMKVKLLGDLMQQQIAIFEVRQAVKGDVLDTIHAFVASHE